MNSPRYPQLLAGPRRYNAHQTAWFDDPLLATKGKDFVIRHSAQSPTATLLMLLHSGKSCTQYQGAQTPALTSIRSREVSRGLGGVRSHTSSTYHDLDQPMRTVRLAAWRLAGPNAHHLAWQRLFFIFADPARQSTLPPLLGSAKVEPLP